MKRKSYRNFTPGVPHHVFTKAIEGNIIFYTVRDVLYYFTIYCCYARKYGIDVNMLCIMPNHTHSNESCSSHRRFELFHCEVESVFAKGYNLQHRRKGPLFLSPFGYSPKMVGKRQRDNLCYIANNPVAGNLCKTSIQYRWNFLAYADCSNPYSDKTPLSRETSRMRSAISMIKYYRKRNLPLDYARLEAIFQNLNPDETQRAIDYIITSYNCINYESMLNCFGGSMSSALNAFNIVSGSEHDMQDDFDDYSIYNRMSVLVKREGMDLKSCNFETMDYKTLNKLMRLLSSTGVGDKQIRKFLHLKPW